ncbi:VOC family protein [Bacillus halotolerans]|uniref:VOC family protein n=1 Tax=Bacillus halotolerans TaxID=260554 RepID=UPI002DB5C797|nr:VOC family protein [Bacillus halotolerans]MEC1645188.1 VOC family protein [Bacillus halotolerans]
MTFHFNEIDHIQLAAPKGCETIARQFYGGILGFREIEKPDDLKARGGVWFTFGNRQLHIGIEESFVPAKKAHPAFEVMNIEGLKEHLKCNGIGIVEDYKLPGADRFYISDPFGNRLEMLERQKTHKKR